MTPLNVETAAPVEPLQTVLAEWIAPNERLLWALVIGAFALDVATTSFGLSIGLVERNPIAASMLAEYGIAALVGLKVLALATGLACRSTLPDRLGAVVPFGMIIPSGAAVLMNTFSIAVAL